MLDLEDNVSRGWGLLKPQQRADKPDRSDSEGKGRTDAVFNASVRMARVKRDAGPTSGVAGAFLSHAGGRWSLRKATDHVGGSGGRLADLVVVRGKR